MDIGSIQCDMFVDITGQDCAVPLSKLAEAVNALQSGKLLLAVTQKDNLNADVPACCRQMNLDLIEQGEDAGQYYFLIRKPE